MPDMTATQRLADHMLGGKLTEYVLSRRVRRVSWRQISLDLHDEIGVDITYQTLINWYGARDPMRADAVAGAA